MVVLGLAAMAALLSGAGRGSGAPILTFDAGTGSSGAENNQSVGWRFTVVSPVTVTGLGWFDDNGDGLATSHTVGIWDPSGALLTSILIPAGTAAPLDGQFRTEAISPITLTPGVNYVVGGENFSTNTERLAFDVSQTVDPHILFGHPTFSNLNSGFTRPFSDSVASTGFYGPSFSFSVTAPAVPEPSSLALLALGGGALAGWRRWRKRRTA
jgi:hypothetical protein